MTEIEMKIDEFDLSWNEELKRAHKNLVFDKISKLKSYTEIEIYLIHYSEKIGYTQGKYTSKGIISPSTNFIFKEFNALYKDRNKKESLSIVTSAITAKG